MAGQPAQQPEVTPAPSRRAAPSSRLLIDEFLPRYDFAVVHPGVFRVPPEVCYGAARGLDLLRDPVVRALLGFRSLPQRLADRLSRSAMRRQEGPRPTFRLDDMIGPPLNWLLLAEEPGVQIVLGQIGRPWKPAGASEGAAGRTGRVCLFRPARVREDCLLPQGRALRGGVVDPHDRDPGRPDRPGEPATVRALLERGRAFRPLDRPDDTSTAQSRAPPPEFRWSINGDIAGGGS